MNEVKLEVVAKRIRAAYNGNLADYIKSRKLNMLEREDNIFLAVCSSLEVMCDELGFQMKPNKMAKKPNNDYIWDWFYRLDSIEYVGKGNADNKDLVRKYINEFITTKTCASTEFIYSWEDFQFKKVNLSDISNPVGLIAFNTVQNRLGIILNEPKPEVFALNILVPDPHVFARTNGGGFQWSNTNDNKLVFYGAFVGDEESDNDFYGMDMEHPDDKVTILKELSDRLGAGYFGKK